MKERMTNELRGAFTKGQAIALKYNDSMLRLQHVVFGILTTENMIYEVVKNKVAPPFKTLELDIVYGKGISRMGEILDLAVSMEIIQKRGSWFRYGGEPIGQGADAAMQFLREDPVLCKNIEDQVRAGLAGIPIVMDDPDTSSKDD